MKVKSAAHTFAAGQRKLTRAAVKGVSAYKRAEGGGIEGKFTHSSFSELLQLASAGDLHPVGLLAK